MKSAGAVLKLKEESVAKSYHHLWTYDGARAAGIHQVDLCGLLGPGVIEEKKPSINRGVKDDTSKIHYQLVGGFKHFIFHFIYGMSSFPLTFIFFGGVGQPPTSQDWVG
jgi:hypothetical protein